MTANTEEKTLPKCPIETTFSLIGQKWKILVIRDLLQGAKRFGELKKSTGATQKSLTTCLRELEDESIVERKVFPQVPPRVDYSLTNVGYSLAYVLEEMAQWGTNYKEYCRLKAKHDKAKS